MLDLFAEDCFAYSPYKLSFPSKHLPLLTLPFRFINMRSHESKCYVPITEVMNENGQYTRSINLRRVNVTILAVEKQR